MCGTNPPCQKGSVLTSDNQCQKGSTLTSDHVGTNPIIISERQFPALTSDHVGTPPTTLSERPSTHIRQPMSERLQHLSSTMRGTNPPCWKSLHLHLTTNVRKAQHLYSTMGGTNPPCQKGSALTFDNQCQKGITFDHARNQSSMLKWLCTYIWSL